MFDNEEHSTHFLNMVFLRILFTWVKQYIGTNSISLLDFVEWLGSFLARVLLLGLFFFCFLCYLYTYRVFWCVLVALLFFNECGFIYIYKKKHWLYN